MPEPFEFNPLDPQVRRHPYALYERGRREFPVFRHEGLPIPVHSVFRYEDTQAILRDAETWSNEFGGGIEADEIGDEAPPSMIGTDAPRHTRLRSLVNKAFTPRIVQRLEPRMAAIAGELLDEALEAEEVDLVQAFTYPLPVVVIAEIIGVPSSDREMFKGWSDRAIANLGLAFFAGPDPDRIRRQRDLFAEMRSYFAALAEERRKQPQEDLLTGLVEAEHEGSRLSHDEMVSMLVLLLVAGNETTTTLIGNAALALHDHPDEQKRLRDDPGLMPRAIDEVLRFSSPVQFDPRRATRNVELHGVEIQKDEMVLTWIGSANRDETVFDRPDVFDVGREKNPHLAFGFGSHYCLGHNLARLEAQVAIQKLLERTARFERTDDDELPLHSSPVFRAASRIPVRLYPK